MDIFLEELRADAYELARHEAGHFVIARALGYEGDEVAITWGGSGNGGSGRNSVTLDRNLPDVASIIAQCRDRVLMLYAGSMAENVQGGRVVDQRVCDDLNTAKAADDFSKVRENLRVIAGASRLEKEDAQTALTRVNDEIWEKAKALVVHFDGEIEKLSKALLNEIERPSIPATIRNWDRPELGSGRALL